MEERHQFATSTIKGFVIDQTHSGVRGLLQLSLNVVGPKGDVMDARTVLLEELGDGTFGIGWLKKLDMNLPRAEEGSLDLLRNDFFAMLAFQAERFFVVGDGFVERFDGDSEVVDFLDHRFNGEISAVKRFGNGNGYRCSGEKQIQEFVSSPNCGFLPLQNGFLKQR